MIIIPSIQLEKGKSLHKIMGEPDTEELYSRLQNNPIELIGLLRRENFKAIHLISRDSIFNNAMIDTNLLKELCSSTDIPIELHANFKNYEDCQNVLNAGIYRIIISNSLINNSELCRELINDFSKSRINFAIILDDSYKVNSKDLNQYSLTELINRIRDYKVNRIFIGTYNSIFNDEYFDLEPINHIFKERSYRITMYGGIVTTEQMRSLHRNKTINIDSAIIGAPLYNNSFACQKIWRLIEKELEK